MQFDKLNTPTLTELFIKDLESKILSGRMSVGDKLPPERELATSMGVSRAVVNTGISSLAKKGFLTVKPRVGTFVADYRRLGTLDTLIAIMNYNGGSLKHSEIISI
ncbi:MAG TPA: winged helix-turn-helix domain-containing protein, partial [Lachnospiraceae bacterium]